MEALIAQTSICRKAEDKTAIKLVVGRNFFQEELAEDNRSPVAHLDAPRGIRHGLVNELQANMRETDLYSPIKRFLESQGYEVKSEIGPVDVMAIRGEESPIVVELKTGFSLALIHQAVARQIITDAVYIAVPRKTGSAFWTGLKSMKKLCRRLGLGLITVRMKDELVEIHCDPAQFRPRKMKVRKDRLLREFARRSGDPNTGGATRTGLVTSYRQDAIKCATLLGRLGPSRGTVVAQETGVTKATRMMADNHYGWFERVERGIYGLTEEGKVALEKMTL